MRSPNEAKDKKQSGGVYLGSGGCVSGGCDRVMKIITHFPTVPTTAKQREHIMLIALKAVAMAHNQSVVTRDIKIEGQLGFKVGAIARPTKTGFSVKTWIEDLL